MNLWSASSPSGVEPAAPHNGDVTGGTRGVRCLHHRHHQWTRFLGEGLLRIYLHGSKAIGCFGLPSREFDALAAKDAEILESVTFCVQFRTHGAGFDSFLSDDEEDFCVDRERETDSAVLDTTSAVPPCGGVTLRTWSWGLYPFWRGSYPSDKGLLFWFSDLDRLRFDDICCPLRSRPKKLQVRYLIIRY